MPPYTLHAINISAPDLRGSGKYHGELKLVASWCIMHTAGQVQSGKTNHFSYAYAYALTDLAPNFYQKSKGKIMKNYLLQIIDLHKDIIIGKKNILKLNKKQEQKQNKTS